MGFIVVPQRKNKRVLFLPFCVCHILLLLVNQMMTVMLLFKILFIIVYWCEMQMTIVVASITLLFVCLVTKFHEPVD